MSYTGYRSGSHIRKASIDSGIESNLFWGIEAGILEVGYRIIEEELSSATYGNAQEQ